jgi:hypothetical protein
VKEPSKVDIATEKEVTANEPTVEEHIPEKRIAVADEPTKTFDAAIGEPAVEDPIIEEPIMDVLITEEMSEKEAMTKLAIEEPIPEPEPAIDETREGEPNATELVPEVEPPNANTNAEAEPTAEGKPVEEVVCATKDETAPEMETKEVELSLEGPVVNNAITEGDNKSRANLA